MIRCIFSDLVIFGYFRISHWISKIIIFHIFWKFLAYFKNSLCLLEIPNAIHEFLVHRYILEILDAVQRFSVYFNKQWSRHFTNLWCSSEIIDNFRTYFAFSLNTTYGFWRLGFFFSKINFYVSIRNLYLLPVVKLPKGITWDKFT